MNEERTTLLVDNSNTRTKFALAEGGELSPGGVRVIPTAELSEPAVRALLRGWEYGRVCISSVVPQSRAVLQAAFPRCAVAHVDAALAPRLFGEYGGRETLGADRVANVLAVVESCTGPVVVVDMGTAVTFDVVCPGPRYRGGVIAPGLRMMADSLHGRTAQLPELHSLFKPGSCIGGNTVEAMQAGVYLAFCGMVRETLQAMARELGMRPHTVATGGDAAMAAQAVPEIDAVDEHLTLRGIAKASALLW